MFLHCSGILSQYLHSDKIQTLCDPIFEARSLFRIAEEKNPGKVIYLLEVNELLYILKHYIPILLTEQKISI